MAHCSWINCRCEYDRMGQRAEGLLPEVGSRQFFCSDACRKAFALRCDGSALRRAAWEQDEGVCRGCDLDTSALVEAIRHMTPLERRRALVEKGFVPKPGFTEARLKKLSAQTEWHSGLGCNLWEADHRLRVANGGGECDEDNIDTLCLVCHGAKSVEENRVARAKKKAAAAVAAGGPKPRKKKKAKKPRKETVVLTESDEDEDDDSVFASAAKPKRKPRRRPKSKRGAGARRQAGGADADAAASGDDSDQCAEETEKQRAAKKAATAGVEEVDYDRPRERIDTSSGSDDDLLNHDLHTAAVTPCKIDLGDSSESEDLMADEVPCAAKGGRREAGGADKGGARCTTPEPGRGSLSQGSQSPVLLDLTSPSWAGGQAGADGGGRARRRSSAAAARRGKAGEREAATKKKLMAQVDLESFVYVDVSRRGGRRRESPGPAETGDAQQPQQSAAEPKRQRH